VVVAWDRRNGGLSLYGLSQKDESWLGAPGRAGNSMGKYLILKNSMREMSYWKIAGSEKSRRAHDLRRRLRS